MTKSEPAAEMGFEILARSGMARTGLFRLPHSVVETPVFMPVGTQGTMKGILPEQLVEMDCRILLCNTYHLGHRPGNELVRKAGGLHRMMNWPRSILTDSGGYQMVSLSKLMSVDEEGVIFESPHTGQITHMTPEHSIKIQEDLGADIMMQLDHVVHVLTEGPLVEKAMHRSIRWLDRCQASQTTTNQALFPIVQGGLQPKLRCECVEEMARRAKVGIAIGGLSGGEEKDCFWRIVALCCEKLPEHLPRYVMGVGFAVDLVICSLLGADMFDCVYPTRTARFGSALVRHGRIMNLTRQEFANDFSPIDRNCHCYTCKHHSRAYLHAVINQETIACHLLTIHNIQHQLDLMSDIREAIKTNSVEVFLKNFLADQYPNGKIPEWIHNASKHMGYKVV